jgi:endonuclease I
MTFKNLKTGILLFGFAVASGATQISAQEGTIDYSAREKMLQETLQLLDKVEYAAPRAHPDLVKIRERLLAIHRSPVQYDIQNADVNPEIMFSRQAVTKRRADKRAKRTAFYSSINGLRNDDLRQKLLDAIDNHKVYDYSDARRIIMLQIDNLDSHIECVYTGKLVESDEMPKPTNMNIEHTWPQSKGATGTAKSDMHHLLPTDSVANSTRSSLPFGEVGNNPKWAQGGSKCDGKRFEVRSKFRGNVARGIFYFAVRYNKNINAAEEDILRKWNKEDPVDANERSRNEKVESFQGNRNPFIDHPEYVDQIADF